MDNVTLNRLKELLSVPSKPIRRTAWLTTYWGLSNPLTVWMCILTIQKHLRKEGKCRGWLFSYVYCHTDTVHELEDVIVVEEAMLPKPATFGYTFDSELHRVLRAFTPEGNPTGIGGDDKCGIFIALELLRKLDNVKVGLFVSEETGCHGSSKCDINFLQDVGYVVQFDAPGNHLITEVCSGIRLFEKTGNYQPSSTCD